MPSWSMCSNSAFATRSRSGAKRLGRACTGGPLVLIWWVTSCLIVASRKHGLEIFGNLHSNLLISSLAFLNAIGWTNYLV